MPRDSMGWEASRQGADEAERAVLDWTESKADHRPVPHYLSRLAAPAKGERPRTFVTFDLVCSGEDDPSTALPIGILVDKGNGAVYTSCERVPEAGVVPLHWLIALGESGTFAVCHNGARFAFHVILRHLATDLVAAGFSIFPYASGTSISGLAIKRGKLSWFLCDVGKMTGTEGQRYWSFLADYGQGQRGGLSDVTRLYGAVDAFQSIALEHFGVGLRVTAGAMATKALAAALPTGVRWYSPNPILAAICRAGGAYRGGVSYGEPHRGPAWKVDLVKAYTHSLSQGIPLRPTMGACVKDGQEQPGIYLCRVEGRSDIPAYIAAWRSSERAFRKQSVRSLRTLAYLPQSEFTGLRAMGYSVVPFFGWRYTDHLSVAPFTDRLEHLQSSFPRGSSQHAFAKALGNSVVGKLGQAPDRTDVCYSNDAPDSTWLPYVTPTQEIVPYLWARFTHKPTGYHHVDSAAVITARVRGRVYSFVAAMRERGADIYHIDTDGVILGADPMGVVALSSQSMGTWRSEGYDPDCMVVRAKCYTWQGKAVTAGVSGVPLETIELVLGGKHVAVGRATLHAPWLPADTVESPSYTLAIPDAT